MDAEARYSAVADDDSGSVYEDSDTRGPSSSNDDGAVDEQVVHASEPKSVLGRGGSMTTQNFSPYQHNYRSDIPKLQDSGTASQQEERRQAASEWASTFQGPQSPTDIKTPTRHVKSKRKAVKPFSYIKAKRLKSWYNSDYRDLFNKVIHDSTGGSTAEYQEPLETSQIGCSTWTAEEKDSFFCALSHLGRDDVRGIASQIQTKSEIEVHEYIQLLHEGMMANSNKLLHVTSIPAAIDITEECCGVLERAGDALAIRQERAEEEVEKTKWDNLWLLNSKINKLLVRGSDRSEVKAVLPAVDLFVLGNWLELSRRVFMNSNSEEYNWEYNADSDETPAIRATAFEDFHSLAVSITQRLISASLFCTMSRRHARVSSAIKHADVNNDDVEAATKILGLKMNSRDFWLGCARRCNLKVFDEEWNLFMSYEEAEKSLREGGERSRSRSASRCRCSGSRSDSRSGSEVVEDSQTYSSIVSEYYESEEESAFSHESVASSGELADHFRESETTSSQSRRRASLLKTNPDQKEELAHVQHIEAFDSELSRIEEQRLWTLLGQTMPFGIKSEQFDLPDPQKLNSRDDMEQTNWRNQLKFQSQWETLETPLSKGHFDNNERTISKRAKRRAERAYGAWLVESQDDKGVESSVESDEAGDGLPRNSHDELVQLQGTQEKEEGRRRSL